MRNFKKFSDSINSKSDFQYLKNCEFAVSLDNDQLVSGCWTNFLTACPELEAFILRLSGSRALLRDEVILYQHNKLKKIEVAYIWQPARIIAGEVQFFLVWTWFPIT